MADLDVLTSEDLPPHVEEGTLATLVGRGESSRAVEYLASSYRSYADRKKSSGAVERAMQVSRIAPEVARPWVVELSEDVAAIRKASTPRTLASLAEAATRSRVAVDAVTNAAKSPAEKYGVALGRLAGTNKVDAEWATLVEDAKALGRHAKVEVDARVLLADVLARNGDAPDARAWLTELARGAKKDALAKIVEAQMSHGDEEALTFVKKFQAEERAEFARHAARAGHIHLAATILDGLPGGDRGAATITCIKEVVVPGEKFMTPLSPFDL